MRAEQPGQRDGEAGFAVVDWFDHFSMSAIQKTPRTNVAAYNGHKYLHEECVALERELNYLVWRGHHMESDLARAGSVWRVMDDQGRTVGEGPTPSEAIHAAMQNEGEEP